jgi:hypothetical protein
MARILQLLERQEQRLAALEKADGAESERSSRGTVKAFGDLFSLDRTLENVKKMKANSQSKHGLVWDMVRQKMCEDPANILSIGSLHNTTDGKRTYFSVRLRVNDDGNHANLHFYGSLRGKMFLVNAVDIFYFSEQYVDAAVFYIKGGL